MPDNLTYSNHIEHYKADAEVADYFNPNKLEAQLIRRRYQYFKFLLKPENNQFILEIGSGGGEAVNILKDQKVKYLPVDLSLKNLARIKHNSDAQPVMADCFDLPYSDSTVDRIIMSEVLEHLHQPDQALNELYRVLKKGGKAVISVPYKEKISYQLCIHCNQLTPTHAHLHSFNEQKLSQWLEQAGFKVVKILKVSNKLSAILRIPLLTKHLPFLIYLIIDSFITLFIPKMSHLIVMVQK
jgi:ubiquinone/menaquinone biosynthesis C-methylase UbiE